MNYIFLTALFSYPFLRIIPTNLTKIIAQNCKVSQDRRSCSFYYHNKVKVSLLLVKHQIQPHTFLKSAL
jgi:hypothetical protein